MLGFFLLWADFNFHLYLTPWAFKKYYIYIAKRKIIFQTINKGIEKKNVP